MRSALVNKETLVVENTIMANPSIDPTPEGYLMVNVDDSACNIGWVYDPLTNSFVNPNPPPPEGLELLTLENLI